MITTTFICDHCEQIVAKDQLFEISIAGKPLNGTYYNLTPACGSAHWCRDCLHKLGWFTINKTPNTSDTPPPPATLEELIRQLVIDTVQENQP